MRCRRYLPGSCRHGIPIPKLGVAPVTHPEVDLSYVKRLVAALLGLFIILVVVGLLSKVGLGFLSLAAALLAMALACPIRKAPGSSLETHPGRLPRCGTGGLLGAGSVRHRGRGASHSARGGRCRRYVPWQRVYPGHCCPSRAARAQAWPRHRFRHPSQAALVGISIGQVPEARHLSANRVDASEPGHRR